MLPENFAFGYPWMLYLVLLPLLVVWLLPAVRHRKTALRAPFFERVAEITGQKPTKGVKDVKRGVLGWLVLSLCWIFALIALASPQLEGEPELKVKTARNFLIAADISFSMAERDWRIDGERATRWEAVKSVMKDFIAEREGDRMGLVFFGSNPYLQVPFTSDLETVEQLLDEADVGMAGQQTNIGKAIGKGIELFKRDTLKTKVMLLLTDGVDSGSELLPMDAADLAKKDSIVVYTLGIGDPNGTGSDLDEGTLINIAEATGGKYFRAIDADALAKVYDELDTLEPIEFEETDYKPTTLLFQYPLGVTLLLSFIFVVIKLMIQSAKRDDTIT